MSKYIVSYFEEQITYALNNILMSSVKEQDAPMAAYQHLATGIEALYKLVPTYIHRDKECNYLLIELLTNNKILHGDISCDEGLKIMDELALYDKSKEI